MIFFLCQSETGESGTLGNEIMLDNLLQLILLTDTLLSKLLISLSFHFL
jgi:hypothetical protein